MAGPPLRGRGYDGQSVCQRLDQLDPTAPSWRTGTMGDVRRVPRPDVRHVGSERGRGGIAGQRRYTSRTGSAADDCDTHIVQLREHLAKEPISTPALGA